MKKRWLITGALSAGLVLSAAPAAMADMWVQGAGNDVAAGSGVVVGSSAGRNIIGETGSTAGARTAEPAEIIVEPKPETGTQIAEGDVPAAGAGAAADAGIITGAETAADTGISAGVAADAGISAGAGALTGDISSGSGVVSAAGTAQGAAAAQDSGVQQVEMVQAAGVQPEELSQASAALEDAGPQGELAIDRTIGRNFIKQSFIDCIGRSRSQVEEILGVTGEMEETEDYAAGKFDYHINYELDKNEDVRIDYKNDIAVRIFGTNVELLNFEKDEYTLSEIDAILQVAHVTLEGNTHFWHLQDDPDVTMELLDNFAFINAY